MDDMRPQGEFTAEGGHGHEASNLNLRGIALFSIGLVALAVGIHLIMGVLMSRFAGDARNLERSRPPRFADVRGQFPGVKLQENAARDMVHFRREEREALRGYGWADRKAGIARIPIDRAIDILAERGLPSRAQAGAKAPSGGR